MFFHPTTACGTVGTWAQWSPWSECFREKDFDQPSPTPKQPLLQNSVACNSHSRIKRSRVCELKTNGYQGEKKEKHQLIDQKKEASRKIGFISKLSLLISIIKYCFN